MEQLGLHGLLFALIAYALTLLGPSVRQVNWVRQSIAVFVVLLIASAVSYWARTLTGQSPEFLILVLQAIVHALLWSPLRLGLRTAWLIMCRDLGLSANDSCQSVAEATLTYSS
jgi:rod shape-determining protein MreD